MQYNSAEEKNEKKAVLVAIITQNQNEEKVNEYLDELAFLTSTLGAKTIKRFTQRLEKPDVRSFIGKGKLEEINAYAQAEKADWVVFDDDLTPSQLRNLEKELKVKIYDRSLLILDIFLNRAQTAQAKTQVELARNQYLLPRLTRMWTHLERQRGGTATRGGAGEKEIETDKRIIRNTITKLKERLAKIEKQSRTQRKSRGKIVRVAIVGYTNVGKSTLMTRLSKSDILAENKLFATVDSTVRKVNFEDIPFLLSDTVGFIRKLPTHLIESFKSTLDEIREADILIHVVDVSHPTLDDHISVVNQTLTDIDAGDKPTLLVFNKVDLLEEEEEISVEEKIKNLKNTYWNKEQNDVVFISATNKENIEELKNKLRKLVEAKHFTIFPNYLKNTYY
ncbi:GTPase HflX [Marivirga tractuosa]|uniref:GTPase HflX n=1 Tax=Marivirga tractuosa (strain ATCC 23168 / DSM 4126 / NBRC 15989 / NCIMB 1408 / VKM B-1430 / H-43) TaxID=643867 RepID=E4TQD6_MARTH|nr:GTPase HflX [Marivirga tractuosa]ADR22659.1 GTP-binding protein HflX [Marivirga tractuosa DSM 4126]BDD16670.1 GTPase HflX [Marivirga tractuosa]